MNKNCYAKNISCLIILYCSIQVLVVCRSSRYNGKPNQRGDFRFAKTSKSSLYCLIKVSSSLFLVSLFIFCSYGTFEKKMSSQDFYTSKACLLFNNIQTLFSSTQRKIQKENMLDNLVYSHQEMGRSRLDIYRFLVGPDFLKEMGTLFQLQHEKP